MQKFYENIIQEIKNNLENDHVEEAYHILKNELSMPYIPKEVEEELESLKKEIIYRLKDTENVKSISIDKILNRLKGNDQSQLSAVSLLSDYNLRAYVREIKDYLEKDPCQEAAAFLLNIIAEQEIKEEFILKKGGLEYTFYGDSYLPAEKSEGFRASLLLLQSLLENDYPMLLNLCRSELIHRCYMSLPLNYDKEEALPLTKSIIEDVSNMLDDGKSYQEIKERIKKLN